MERNAFGEWSGGMPVNEEELLEYPEHVNIKKILQSNSELREQCMYGSEPSEFGRRNNRCAK